MSQNPPSPKWIVTAAQAPPVGKIVQACWHPPGMDGFVLLDAVLDNDAKWKIITTIMAVGLSAPDPGPPNFWRPQQCGPDIDGIEADKG